MSFQPIGNMNSICIQSKIYKELISVTSIIVSHQGLVSFTTKRLDIKVEKRQLRLQLIAC